MNHFAFTEANHPPPLSLTKMSVFACLSLSPSQILIGEVTGFFVKTEGAQEKTIVTADCCYFNPLLRRIVRFLGQSRSEGSQVIQLWLNRASVLLGQSSLRCRPGLLCHKAKKNPHLYFRSPVD